MIKTKVRLTKRGAPRHKGAVIFWESFAAWNKCLDDERMKAAFIAGYMSGWERNKRPPPPAQNVVAVEF
jgi:hypothetical protein